MTVILSQTRSTVMPVRQVKPLLIIQKKPGPYILTFKALSHFCLSRVSKLDHTNIVKIMDTRNARATLYCIPSGFVAIILKEFFQNGAVKSGPRQGEGRFKPK